MELLISEEMLLLALDNEKGGTTWLSGWGALTGGVLVDALVHGALTVDGDVLRPGTEPEHPLLRRVRDAVAREPQPRKLADWVQRLPVAVDPFLEAVAQRLVEFGVLTEHRTKILGIFDTTRFPEADPSWERALRERLRSVLVDGVEPTPHDQLLIALVQPAGLLVVTVEEEDRMVRRLARRRAAELAERATAEPAGAAVQAVTEVNNAAAIAAVMGAVVATTATVTATNPGD